MVGIPIHSSRGYPSTDDVRVRDPNNDEVRVGYPSTDDVSEGYPSTDNVKAGCPCINDVRVGYVNIDDSRIGYPSTDDVRVRYPGTDNVRVSPRTDDSNIDNVRIGYPSSEDDKVKFTRPTACPGQKGGLFPKRPLNVIGGLSPKSPWNGQYSQLPPGESPMAENSSPPGASLPPGNFPLYGAFSREASPKKTKSFVCELCGKVYGTWAGRYYHNQMKHGVEKKFKCAMCEKAFPKGSDLNRHMQSIHKNTLH